MAKKKSPSNAILSVTPRQDQELPEVPEKDVKLGDKEREDVIIKREVIPLWEAKWNKDALLEKRSDMGAREFDRGYRQRAISDEDLLFKRQWVENCLDKDLILPDSCTPKSFWSGIPRDGGVDLAIASAEKEAAFFSICGIATTKDWHRWLMCFFFQRGLSFGQQVGSIVDYHDWFGFDICTVESNAYQESIIQHMGEAGFQGSRVPIIGFKTGRIQKVDMELGVPSLAVEFEQKRWHIPWGNRQTRRILEPLVEELFQYPLPGFHDDGIMSMFFARESRRAGMRVIPKIRVLRF
jgi:hypothetical protein